MNKWNWIKVSERLPEFDQPALWLYECGIIIHEAMDKDFGQEHIDKFLAGHDNTGPITHWCEIVYPEES